MSMWRNAMKIISNSNEEVIFVISNDNNKGAIRRNGE
jgi:hypothetical protein